jgi:hypothetical protein
MKSPLNRKAGFFITFDQEKFLLIRIYTITLLLVLLAPFAYKSYLVLDYVILQDYYATELCINKNNPDKNCNGVCQLNKELSNKSQKSDQNTPINLQELNISAFVLPDSFFWHSPIFEINKKDVISKVCFYNYDFENKNLKPPKPSC